MKNQIAALETDFTVRGNRSQNKPPHDARPRRHLVIHFDVNETILVGDEAGGDSREDSVNKLLAKSAFCKMPLGSTGSISYEATSQLEPTEWWDGTPIKCSYEESDRVPPLYTGWEWPKGCCPYYRTKFKKRAKSFVTHHGAIYQSTYEKLQRDLTPSLVDGEHPVHPILSHMLPSFFHTIRELSAMEAIDFSIVIRTMGTDLPDIAQAISLFAEGKHPDHREFTNPSLKLDEQLLMKGRWATDPTRPGQYIYQLWKGDSVVASGDKEVVKFLHSNKISGIQDDYPFWKEHDQKPWAGKPIWALQQRGDGDTVFHHVLLDDNIHNIENDSIAGVRVEQEDGCFMSASDDEIRKLHGVHLIKVPTVAAVLDKQWFLDHILASTCFDRTVA